MRLLIISNMSHYHDAAGRIVGWGPTVNEIDALAKIFDEIRHIGCLHTGAAPVSALPYCSKNVRLIPVAPAGGDGIWTKIGILVKIPEYVRAILSEIWQADVVHVRCPANIPLIALLLLTLLPQPKRRWIKYAGNWQPEGREALSYRFQRWWLKRGFAQALVTVNGSWSAQPPFIRSFFNPCLTVDEMHYAATQAASKHMSGTLKMIFVGRVESAKGMEMTLLVLAQLHQEGIPVTLDIAGDGPERASFEAMAIELRLQDAVRFHGWVPRTMMGELYADAHLILLPTTTEGWPKVLSEAMAYGVVPVASDVSSIGQYLRRFDLGCAVKPIEVQNFVEAVKAYIRDPQKWKEESERAMAAADHFTYDAYLQAVQALLDIAGSVRNGDG